jgi:hypothetical protein
MFGTSEPAVSLATRENQMGRRFDIFHDYHGGGFGKYTPKHAGRLTLLTLASGARASGTKTWVQQTNSGALDSAIRALRDSISTPTFVGIWQEMNGGWMSTNAAYIGGAANYVSAWRRAATILRGNPNIILCWAPNVYGFAGSSASDPAPYWPGADLVDWVTPDGYCHGNYHTFDYLFGKVISEYGPSGTKHQKPIMVAETAAQKALTPDKYVQSVHTSLKAAGNKVKGIVWFDNPWSTNGYNVDATAAELAAYKSLVTDPTLNVP